MPPSPLPSDAIPPPDGNRRSLDARLWPFTYEIDPAAILLILGDYERALVVEREVLAWALKRGRRRTARNARAFIDHLERRRRNGWARLRQIGPAAT